MGMNARIIELAGHTTGAMKYRATEVERGRATRPGGSEQEWPEWPDWFEAFIRFDDDVAGYASGDLSRVRPQRLSTALAGLRQAAHGRALLMPLLLELRMTFPLLVDQAEYMDYVRLLALEYLTSVSAGAVPTSDPEGVYPWWGPASKAPPCRSPELVQLLAHVFEGQQRKLAATAEERACYGDDAGTPRTLLHGVDRFRADVLAAAGSALGRGDALGAPIDAGVPLAEVPADRNAIDDLRRLAQGRAVFEPLLLDLRGRFSHLVDCVEYADYLRLLTIEYLELPPRHTE